MIPAILIAAASAVCPDESEPYMHAGAFKCSTTDITDAANVTEITLCAPAQPGYSCCVATIHSDQIYATHYCYDDYAFQSARCADADTGIINHTYEHTQFEPYLFFLFNCTNLEAPAPPPLSTEEPAPVTPAPPAEDSGLSAGAIAGIAVGAVLAVVAAGVVLL
jgi:hypothetical protein